MYIMDIYQNPAHTSHLSETHLYKTSRIRKEKRSFMSGENAFNKKLSNSNAPYTEAQRQPKDKTNTDSYIYVYVFNRSKYLKFQ